MISFFSKIAPRATEAASNQGLYRWFHRCLGFVYLCAFVPMFFEVPVLIGSGGLLPAGNLLQMTCAQKGAFFSFFQFPSLFHFVPYDAFLYVLIGLGVLGATLLVLGYRIFFGALLSWISFLSLTSIGGDFFVIIIDLFLAEVGFLAVFSSYSFQKYGYVPRLIDFAFRVLNFRLWFCMGINKFYQPTAVWTDFTFFDYFFQAQPMPTPLAPVFNRAPVFLKGLAIVALFIAEMIVPFFVFGKKKLRLLSFFTFVLISVLIQLGGNYGYFNILSIVLALLILHDGDLFPVPGQKHTALNVRPVSWVIKTIVSFQLSLQFIYCLFVFHPKPYSPQNHFNYIFSTIRPENKALNMALEPLRWPEYWRICTPYGLFKSIPKYHAEIRFYGSSDSLHWQAYGFRFLPSGRRDYLGFYAPYYPRLDHLFFYEGIAAQNYKWNPLNRFYKEDNSWIGNFVAKLLQNDPKLTGLLKENPFQNQAAPVYVRAEVFRLSFDSGGQSNWKADSMGFSKVYTLKTLCKGPILNSAEARATVFGNN